MIADMVRFSVGAHTTASILTLTFDRNESLKGHIEDRLRSRKARHDLKERYGNIDRITVANAHDNPALQMADLYAWCYSNPLTKGRKFQRKLRSHKRWRFCTGLILKETQAPVDHCGENRKFPGAVEYRPDYRYPRSLV